MEKMGFGKKLISWIKWCISTTTFSVLFDGSPTGFFRSFGGLRQGDPLSLYLFVIGMEALSRLLKRVVEDNFISGCKFEGRDGGELIISHLLYANDTVLLCDSKPEQLIYLGWILMWFEAVSGLRINLSKSEIILVGTVSNVETLAIVLGCSIGSLPTTCLGLELLTRR